MLNTAELHQRWDELHVDDTRASVTVLFDNEHGFNSVFLSFRVIFFGVVAIAVQEDDHVGILLDRSGFAEMAQFRKWIFIFRSV